MTVKLSPQKVAKILRYYFSGIPQMKIAKKSGVDQSSISIYATRFKERVSEVGIIVAGKEYGLMEEVDALRSLSVELHKTKLTVDEAKEGIKIIKAFIKLGISPVEHMTLVKVCKEVNNPGFVNAALKLVKIESDGNTSYEEVVSGFQEMTLHLPVLEKQIENRNADLNSINSNLADKKQELASLKEKLSKLKKLAEDTLADTEQEISTKMKEAKVTEREIEEIAKLKADLDKKGLDISTLVKLAEEVGNESGEV